MILARLLQKRGAVDEINAVAVEANGIGGVAVKVAHLIAGEVADIAVEIQRIDLCKEAVGIAEALGGEEGLHVIQRRGGVAHGDAEDIFVVDQVTRGALHGKALHKACIVGVRAAERHVRNGVGVIKGGVLAVAIRLIAAGGEGECDHKSKCHKSKETFAGFHVGFLLILVLLYGVLRRSQLVDGDRPAAARKVHDVG